MKNRNPFDTAIITLSIITFIGSSIAYPTLPDSIPTQWNVQGGVSNYSPKIIIFLLGLLPSFIYYIMSKRTHQASNNTNLSTHRKSYRIITNATTLLLNLLVWLTILVSFNPTLHVLPIIILLTGIIFIIIGNYLPTTKKTFTVGVRNQWTYSNPTVWRKSNKLCGYLFVSTGILFLLTILFPYTILYYFIVFELLFFYIVINVYSYIIYKKSL